MIYPGFFVATFAKWTRLAREKKPLTVRPDEDEITVDNHQSNGSYGIHQARVRLKGDPTTYRMIIAPADAPITIRGHAIGEHFSQPLGEG